jgi:delta8-fatty-acid desaturase
MILREENGQTVEVPLYAKKIQDRLDKLPCITFEKIEAHNVENDCWIVIHNLVFDVSSFSNTHPGGKLVLINSGGKDVTDAFENYHNASIHNKLHPFLVGKVLPTKVPDHLIAFRNLRQTLLKNNLFLTNHMYYLKLSCVFAFIFITSICLSMGIMDNCSYQMRLVGASTLGIFWQQLSGIGHDLGHSGVTHTFAKDHLYGSVLISILGLSIGWWKIDHNNHHVNTNSIEYDPNIQHFPLLATSTKMLCGFYDRYHKKYVLVDRLTRRIISQQHWFVYPLVIIFGRFNLYIQQLVFMYTGYDKHKFLKIEMYGFLLFISWYFFIAFSQPNLFWSVLWILISHITSGILHIQIVISHWAMEKYILSLPCDDWYVRQLKTTMDIKTKPCMDFIHVGLQFQIEHHMYPRIPRHNLRKVQCWVKDICHKFDIKYVEMSFLDANIFTWKTLKHVSQIAKEQ